MRKFLFGALFTLLTTPVFAQGIVYTGPSTAASGSSGGGTVNQGTAGSSAWLWNLSQVGGTAFSLGQKPMASSLPVVLPSDQTVNVVSTPPTVTNVVSTAAESSHVLKAAAGSLYSVYAVNFSSTNAWLLILNSATVPADGAVTPLDFAPLPANSVANISYTTPEAYSTGITAVISSAATVFTKTTGTVTGAIHGVVQ